MAKFTIVPATKSLPAVSTGVFGSADVPSRGAAAASTGAFGQSLAWFGTGMHLGQGKTEWATAAADINDIYQNALSDMDAETDETKYAAIHERAVSNIDKRVASIKNGWAMQQAERQLPLLKSKYKAITNKKYRERMVDNFEHRLSLERQRFIDGTSSSSIYKLMLDSGVDDLKSLSKDAADAQYARDVVAREHNMMLQMAQIDPYRVKTDIGEALKTGNRSELFPGMDTGQLQEGYNNALGAIAKIQKESFELFGNKIVNLDFEPIVGLKGDTLPKQIRNNPNLDSGQKHTLLGRHNSAIASLKVSDEYDAREKADVRAVPKQPINTCSNTLSAWATLIRNNWKVSYSIRRKTSTVRWMMH
jgi:hypothetical protein